MMCSKAHERLASAVKISNKVVLISAARCPLECVCRRILRNIFQSVLRLNNLKLTDIVRIPKLSVARSYVAVST